MHINRIEEEVLRILTNNLELNNHLSRKKLLKNEIEEWDSLKHITIITELETVFDIQFEPNEIELLVSSEIIIDLISKKL